MEKYRVKPLKPAANMEISVPGSKSITNRALLMAALSDGRVCLKGVLFSDDSRYFLKALEELGFKLQIDEEKKEVTVTGEGGMIPEKSGEIYVGSAGTAARFLTAMLGLSGGTYTIQASEQMKKRPMKTLFQALEQLGVHFDYLENEYFLPVRTLGKEAGKNRVTLDISQTSQPLSALLMASVMCNDGISIDITSEKKQGTYIEITRKMMQTFGMESIFDGTSYHTRAGHTYHLSSYQIEPDVSAACYFYGLAAITGTSVTVKHIHMDTLQGDIRFTKVLEQMGCHVMDTTEGIRVSGPCDHKLHGLTVNMNQFSDQALTLAAISVFADCPVRIEGIAHIRLQECDRIKAISQNMKRLGIRCEEEEDAVTVYPGKTVPCEIETYEDHRVAMAFTLIGLLRDGITILNPLCCKKTFDNYYDVIESLYPA